jgi:Rrf2 family protein
MLEITRQADYALRAVSDIARIPSGERTPTALIASRQNIPLPFLAKIVSQLVVRGVLETVRGASGGVRLARDPESITMREIIEAIDGPIAINRCTREPSACSYMNSCPYCEVFTDVQKLLVDRLDQTSIAHIVQQLEQREPVI